MAFIQIWVQFLMEVLKKLTWICISFNHYFISPWLIKITFTFKHSHNQTDSTVVFLLTASSKTQTLLITLKTTRGWSIPNLHYWCCTKIINKMSLIIEAQLRKSSQFLYGIKTYFKSEITSIFMKSKCILECEFAIS